jgi:hypothetical protein
LTFEVELSGRTRTVTIEPVASQPRRYRVAIDGRRHTLDAVRTGDFVLSLLRLGGDTPVGASIEIGITPGTGPGEVLISIGGRLVAATVDGHRRARADAGTQVHGEQTVVAPMPGRVVRVLVEAGEQVAARQGVVIVEAMKMENELRAPKAGRVKDVGVTPGASVEAGRVLVVIE